MKFWLVSTGWGLVAGGTGQLIVFNGGTPAFALTLIGAVLVFVGILSSYLQGRTRGTSEETRQDD